MKFKLLGTSLIPPALILFHIPNFFLWPAVVMRIANYNHNLLGSAMAHTDNALLNYSEISTKNILFIRDLVKTDIASKVDGSNPSKKNYL